MSRRLVDLSFTISEEMLTFSAPWHPAVEITQLGRHQVERRETRRIVLGTHTGTHVDAPLHFIERGRSVDELPLDLLVGPAAVVDLSWAEDRHEVTQGELLRSIPGGDLSRLILKFDWDRRAPAEAYFIDHPFLSGAACRYLVDNGCRLLAMDTPQPDNPADCFGSGNDAPNHRILLGGGIVLVEYLSCLRSLKHQHVELVVAPLKILGGDGAPARCFAIELSTD